MANETEILARLADIERLVVATSKTTLTMEDAVIYTGLSKGYFYQLTSKRMIPHYKKANKVYFDRCELDKWLQSEPQTTKDEIEAMADDYIKRVWRKG